MAELVFNLGVLGQQRPGSTAPGAGKLALGLLWPESGVKPTNASESELEPGGEIDQLRLRREGKKSPRGPTANAGCVCNSSGLCVGAYDGPGRIYYIIQLFKPLWSKYHHPHLTDEETTAQES